MANKSIFDAFERMWQHIVARFGNYTTSESFNSHVDNKSNPHEVTKEQVGLGNVDNTADIAKAVLSATKATQDANGNDIAATYETKSEAESKLAESKAYSDAAAAAVKNDLLNGAGEAYDTLKELGDLIDENTDALQALEEVATNKANKSDIVQSDWNQNDESALDYIKNRPFYIIGEEFEESVNLVLSDINVTGNYICITTTEILTWKDVGTVEDKVLHFTIHSPSKNLTEEYILHHSTDYGENEQLWKNDDTVLVYYGFMQFDHFFDITGLANFIGSTDVVLTFSWGNNVERIKTLEEKFISDTIARVNDIPEQITTNTAIRPFPIYKTEVVDDVNHYYVNILDMEEYANYAPAATFSPVNDKMHFIIVCEDGSEVSVCDYAGYNPDPLIYKILKSSTQLLFIYGNCAYRITASDEYTTSSDITNKEYLTNFLYLGSTTANFKYTPTANYHPAPKKYVDDAIALVEDQLDGKASAGYGYGENLEITANTGESFTDKVDALTVTWGDRATKHYLAFDANLDEHTMDATITKHSDTVTIIDGLLFNGCKVIRKKINGVWDEWEWQNPLFYDNTEYRTTEHYQGNPVYAKHINYGTLAVADTTVTIPLNITDTISSIVDFEVLVKNASGNILKFPPLSLYDAATQLSGYCSPSQKTIVLQTHVDLSGATAKVFVKYTKA